MTPYPGFGIVLQRVLEHRGTDAGWLAESSGLALPDVHAVVNGAVPTPDQLHALASALGYRVPDLFVLADVPVPPELTPLDPEVGSALTRLLIQVDHFSPDQRREIRELVAGLPQEPRPESDGPVRGIFSAAEGGFGAVLMTMLTHNRNLRSDAVGAMISLSQTRMYVAEATGVRIMFGRTPLRPDWILSFAVVLDIPAGDLSAMTGVPLPEEPFRRIRKASELKDLLWSCRRLTAAQVKEVYAAAEAMVVPIPEGAPESAWTRIRRTADGAWWGAPRVPED